MEGEEITGANPSENEPEAIETPLIEDEDAQPWETFGEERPAEEEPEGETKEGEDSEDKPEEAEPEEKTEEEKQLDEELKKLGADPEQMKGVTRHLRNVSKGLLKAKAQLTADNTRLQTELEAAQGVMFRPTLPAEEFAAQGKPKEFWDGIAKEYPGYHDALVTEAMRPYLTPANLATGALPEPVVTALQDVFAKEWLPGFIKHTFAMGVDEFSTLIESHKNGTLYAHNSGSPSLASPEQLIQQLGLNPDSPEDAPMVAQIRQLAATAGEVNQLKTTVKSLVETQKTGSTKAQESEAESRVASLESMLQADIDNLLGIAMKGLPRNPDGSVHKDYAHLPQKIARLVKVELGETPEYTTTRDHTKKWFKQPGSVETAKTLAASDLRKLYARHKQIVTAVANQELAPYVEKLRLSKQVETNQRERKVIPGGVNPSLSTGSAPPAARPAARPPTLAERARMHR